MSEEIQNAAIVVPRTIVWGIIFNGMIGLAMFLAVLFCLGDPQTVSTQTEYVYPFVLVLQQATLSSAGTAVIMVVILVVDVGLNIGVLAAASRMLWSFSRDRGVPGWRWISKVPTILISHQQTNISKVNQQNSIPVPAIITTTVVSILLGLISVGSAVAFNDLVSLAVNGLYASYLVACALLLWRRCTGSIKDLSTVLHDSDDIMNTNLPGSAGHLVWGPWKMPEVIGRPVNAFACIYLTVVFFFTFWPPVTPVTPDTMNYSSLVMGFVAIMSGIYYTFRAHKTYTGPVVDVNLSR